MTRGPKRRLNSSCLAPLVCACEGRAQRHLRAIDASMEPIEKFLIVIGGFSVVWQASPALVPHPCGHPNLMMPHNERCARSFARPPLSRGGALGLEHWGKNACERSPSARGARDRRDRRAMGEAVACTPRRR